MESADQKSPSEDGHESETGLCALLAIAPHGTMWLYSLPARLDDDDDHRRAQLIDDNYRALDNFATHKCFAYFSRNFLYLEKMISNLKKIFNNHRKGNKF